MGGYEWTADVLSSSSIVKLGSTLKSLVCRGLGMFVLELNVSAASTWWGEVGGTGIIWINTPGGKDGARIRIYHPRERGR